ncbi:RagB/SusD family nutrient uptake outer membrane protein [Cytophagaceae bacterium DM2B3-1]|uniref:RagB/SusD family nutrient uptake outer membrane protein n=1 Tax=Xanthocytophaga flava TaxID=3048013 RepID=A0ABT7CM25_9BACT|nr:RagB/SusD family nutrient uptake outer membrane protein [Xanthocytophaga flavus]MDJ1494045.1 RagB/SusD family nutrient uptake outer membrane protein [Xanthocytophaga flavus]
MNKIRYISLCFIVTLLLITSCNDDFLNTKPLGEVPDDALWKDAALTEAFVTQIYNGLGQGGFNEQMLASLTDEAIFTHPGRGINTITESRSNPADRGWINGTLDWPAMYQRIRACNLALEHLESPEFENANGIVERLRGEALFLRAYYYHQLVRYYGGVPLIERSYGLGEADYTVPRNTFEECVNFIVKDCDEAAQLLDGKAMANGRASKGAALALKSRILLYAASDLHDIPTASTKSATIGGFSDKNILGYIDGSRDARWLAAKNAAKAVLDLTGYGYQTNLSAPVTPAQGTTNYMNMSLSKGGGESELIFARYFINLKQEDGGRVGLFNGPNGYHNWAGNTPIQNLVDDYEMMDGTSFDWNNPDHASAPYQNRDPRMDATILHDGSPWKPRTADGAGKDPNNQIQTGQYQILNSKNEVVSYFGLDTRQSSIEDWNGSRTGYYMRKFIDPNPTIVDQNTWQEIPWPFFRYTEAMFNYAEACIELGEDEEARTWLNKIRFRAGMPAITESGDALKQRYRNERRIEMAYEEQRYHDARRWMIAPETLGQKAGIINITATFKPGKSLTLYKYDPQTYNYVYTPLNIDPGIENRLWLDKMYYLPISRDEINRNAKLVQNPGF